MLQRWWGQSKEADSLALDVIELQPTEQQNMHGILEENERLKCMLEIAMTSHLIMNGATNMLDERAEHWMKRTVDAVDAKVHQAEQQRDALTLELKDLQDKLGDKDQEIERLRDGFVWATENLNTKEDEICELQERLDRYEALLKVLDGAKVV
ncbi:hypothetical protein BBO99_00000736 [Phytophthora kernoviae]|uniref:Uncharacterized protein n=2 Tax=Phytophthora kernoviae TaxID=325452 RepID=A0A3R7HNI6_9STRA|nr:hypothetical protein G195_005188 [Phytophthora kernoviae 00238/432]KAG2527692.1 hypothetical protein JM16_001576 [Phytophthora kernoviae]KAG2528988.1 hypothetical protein JM18_001890 [Phytophthora kernoviae]RLN46809.1 hypothetical protein BBI17_000700 [Phytophthora kernoviae]RLN85150.1 hypothetical protein BBO99_00000736 [Phytophthora kernoviae]